MKQPVIVLGGGGHSRVLIEVLKQLSLPIQGFTDPNNKVKTIFDIKYLGHDDVVFQWPIHDIFLVNGVGSTEPPVLRKQLFLKFKQSGYFFANIIHPAAVISPSAQLAEGAQIMAGAVVQTGCRLGINVLINTRASLDHDCTIGDHVHIAPGATLCGGVTVGDCSHIGSGATVIQGVTIGKNCMIGAGSLVLKDVPDGAKVMGVPAKEV